MKPTPSLFTAQVAGTVEAVAALLKIDAMKPYASLPIDPSTLKGNITGKLGVGLRLGPVMKPKDTELTIDANATNLTADHLVGKELLENANLNVLVGASGLSAKGQGRIYDAPATIDIEKPIDQQATASISILLDDATRAKQGLWKLFQCERADHRQSDGPAGRPAAGQGQYRTRPHACLDHRSADHESRGPPRKNQLLSDASGRQWHSARSGGDRCGARFRREGLSNSAAINRSSRQSSRR